MILPESYVIQKLLSYAHEPVHNRNNSTYNAGCPVCKEGRHIGRKKRLYFYIKTNSFYCFNCNRSWSALSWVQEVSKLSFKEIKSELQSNNYRVDITQSLASPKKQNKQHTLPHDSINLFDKTQTNHFKQSTTIREAVSFIEKRRLNTAINKPKALYISLTDFIHKNRLCIPFYDVKNDICFYQTRSIDGSEPKYLSKLNADKSLYGINNINSSIDYIFIFEGPIDSMFVQNGVAATGLSLTTQQKKLLEQFPFHKKIWVPDNQNVDSAAKQKTEELIKNNSSVFVWPSRFAKCKDFNDIAILLQQDSISHDFIIKNTKIF